MSFDMALGASPSSSSADGRASVKMSEGRVTGTSELPRVTLP